MYYSNSVIQHIVHTIIRDAIWTDAAHCTWLVPTGQAEQWETANSSLYNGTAGIALALALYAAAAQSDEVDYIHKVVRSACNSAVASLVHMEPSLRCSVYRGWLSTGRALLEIGALLGDASIKVTALEIIRQSQAYDPHYSDVLDGAAGALAYHVRLGNHHAAQYYATYLHDTAQYTDNRHAACWHNNTATRGLCGLSHGNAGIAYALACYAYQCNQPASLTLARAALNYERYYYSHGTWRDLRKADAPLTPPWWCHGSAGGALVRHALLQLPVWHPQERTQLEEELRAALHYTQVGETRCDDSLCHGSSGRRLILSLLGVINENKQIEILPVTNVCGAPSHELFCGDSGVVYAQLCGKHSTVLLP